MLNGDMENKEVFHPTENMKNKSFSSLQLQKIKKIEGKKFSVPFKTRSFEGYKTGNFESF